MSPAWRDGAGHPALPVREAGRDEERAHLAAAHPGHAALVAADHAARAQLEPAATSRMLCCPVLALTCTEASPA